MLLEGICATMSISSLFLPTKIGGRMRQQAFVGGALGTSNPTRELLNEAANVFGKDRRVAQIISIGAGMPRAISLGSSEETTDIKKLLQSTLTDCEVVAKELSNRLFTVDAYLRLSVDRGMEDISMIDWSILGDIESHTDAYVETSAVAEAFEASLGRLRSKLGSLSLGNSVHISLSCLVLKLNSEKMCRSYEQHQDYRQGGSRGISILCGEEYPMGCNGPSSHQVSAFASEDLLHYGNGWMWQDTNGLIFFTGISGIVGVLLIPDFIC